MRKRQRQEIVHASHEGGETGPGAPSPLFPPVDYGSSPAAGSLKRTILAVVLAVLLTLLVVGALVGGFLAYNGKRNEVSDLRQERSSLEAKNQRLLTKLGRSEKETKAAHEDLRTLNRKLRKARSDLVAAKKDASAQYGAGFSAGTSTGYSAGADDSYNSGWNDGWDVGYDSAYNYCSSVTFC